MMCEARNRVYFLIIFIMEDQFSTSDVSLAATIISTLGTHLINVKPSVSGDFEYVFPKEEISLEFVEAYNLGNLRVEPLIYSLSLSFLADKTTEAKKTL